MYKLVIALVLFVMLIGCGPQTKVVEVPVTPPAQIVHVTATPSPLPTVTPTPEVSIEPVHLVAEDGVELSAHLFGSEGDTAILLAHMGIADQRSWHPFARTITAQGFVALTFDFRGYGESASGSSTGRDLGHYMDAQAAVDFLQERGFSRIVCIGASMGGAACMNVALENDLVGLVVIGSPLPRQVIGKSYPQDLVRPDMPKLIIVTDNDPYVEVVSAASQLYEMSPEPKEIKVSPATSTAPTSLKQNTAMSFAICS